MWRKVKRHQTHCWQFCSRSCFARPEQYIYTYHTQNPVQACVCVLGRYLCHDVRHRYIEFNWISGNRQCIRSASVQQPRQHSSQGALCTLHVITVTWNWLDMKNVSCAHHHHMQVVVYRENIPYIHTHSWRVNIQRRHVNIRTTNHMVWLHMRHDDTTATTTSPRTQIGVMRQFLLLFFLSCECGHGTDDGRVCCKLGMEGVVNWVWWSRVKRLSIKYVSVRIIELGCEMYKWHFTIYTLVD